MTFTKGLGLSRHFEVLERKRYKMSWGPATVFIHRRLQEDGTSVGGFRLNLLPSDDHSYSDAEDDPDKGGAFNPDEDEDDDDQDEDSDDAADRYERMRRGALESDDDDEYSSDEYEDDDDSEDEDESAEEEDDDEDDEDERGIEAEDDSEDDYAPGKSYIGSSSVPTTASGSPLRLKVTPLTSKGIVSCLFTVVCR